MKDNKPNLHRLNVIRPVALKPEISLTKHFRQPTSDELTQLVLAVVEHELHAQADEATRAGVFKLAACYDEAYPHHLRYERHVKTTEVSETHFQKNVHYWAKLNDKNRRKAMALASEYLRATVKKLAKVGEFLQHQQDLMKDWDDNQLETIAKIQKQMGLATQSPEQAKAA
jgi:hypothetical protein